MDTTELYFYNVTINRKHLCRLKNLTLSYLYDYIHIHTHTPLKYYCFNTVYSAYLIHMVVNLMAKCIV